MKLIATIILSLGLSGIAYADPVTVSPRQGASAVDYTNARLMPLPKAAHAPLPSIGSQLKSPGVPGVSPGAIGSGGMSGGSVPMPKLMNQSAMVPEEAGTSNHPFSTSWANAWRDPTFNDWPFRAAGRLFFNIPGQGTFVCSASLIKPGVIVTAAHCVANFGHQQFYNSWTFIPAYFQGAAAYGVWTARSAAVMTAYYNGTDSCAQSGVVCQDDVAVILLNPQNGNYAGNMTGWYGYGWNGFSYFPWLGLSQ